MTSFTWDVDAFYGFPTETFGKHEEKQKSERTS